MIFKIFSILILLVSGSILNALGLGEVYDYDKGYVESDREWVLDDQPINISVFSVKDKIDINNKKMELSSNTEACDFFKTYYNEDFRGEGVCQDGDIPNQRSWHSLPIFVKVKKLFTIKQLDLDKMRKIYEPTFADTKTKWYDFHNGIYDKGPTKFEWKKKKAENDASTSEIGLNVIDRDDTNFILHAKLTGAAPLTDTQHLYLIRNEDLKNDKKIKLKDIVKLVEGNKAQEIDFYHIASKSDFGLNPGEEAHKFGKFECQNGQIKKTFNDETQEWEYYCEVEETHTSAFIIITNEENPVIKPIIGTRCPNDYVKSKWNCILKNKTRIIYR